jgi:hypothetical protein
VDDVDDASVLEEETEEDVCELPEVEEEDDEDGCALVSEEDGDVDALVDDVVAIFVVVVVVVVGGGDGAPYMLSLRQQAISETIPNNDLRSSRQEQASATASEVWASEAWVLEELATTK